MKFDYLTEHTLESLLKIIFDENEIIIKNKKHDILKFKPDYFLPDRNIIIDFDGPWHFMSPSVVVRDIEKDNLAKEMKIKYIRIPYFMQLDSEAISIFFSKEIKIDNFPHGFINPQRYLPGDYCSLGVHRFIDHLFKLDRNGLSHIKHDILSSLINQFTNKEFKKNLCDICPKTEDKWFYNELVNTIEENVFRDKFRKSLITFLENFN
jgi:hypothetical protein